MSQTRCAAIVAAPGLALPSAADTFKSTGASTQLCSIHPEMLAYVFVRQDPFASTVDGVGHFAIHDVPPGTWELVTWNAEKLESPANRVTVSAGKTAAETIVFKR